MPIMSAQQKNDARGTARLLALAARESIRNPEQLQAGRQVVLNNVYRLLEEYRVTAFFGLESSPPMHSARTTEAISLLPRAERNVRDVRLAMEEAQAATFPGKSKDEAINAVARVLRGIAYPEKSSTLSSEDTLSSEELTQAGNFFDQLVTRLSS